MLLEQSLTHSVRLVALSEPREHIGRWLDLTGFDLAVA